MLNNVFKVFPIVVQRFQLNRIKVYDIVMRPAHFVRCNYTNFIPFQT